MCGRMTAFRQRLAVGVLAAAAFVVIQGPTAVALLRQPREMPPISVGLYNLPDAASYLASMEQARQTPSLFLENRFSPEPAPPVFMPYWALLGVASRWLSASTPVVYIAAILFMGTALLLLACGFARRAVGASSGFVAAAMVATAGGVGWLGAVAWSTAPSLGLALQRLFPDWFQAGLTWTGVLASSSHPFVVGMLMLALFWTLLRRPGTVASALAFVLACALGILHPYSIGLVAGVAVAVPLLGLIGGGTVRPQSWAAAAAATAGEAAAATYYLWAIARNPGLSSWYGQNVLPTPNPIGLLLAYLPLLPLVYLGVRALWRRWQSDAFSRLMLVWLALPLALAYLPLPFQRRFLDGYYVPLGLVAAVGWLHWQPRKPAARAIAAVGIGTLLAVTPLFRAAVQIDRLINWRQQASLVTEDEIAAVRWAGDRCGGGVVLMDRIHARLWVPFLAPRCRTDAAHPHLTVDFQRRAHAAYSLFGYAEPAEAEAAWRGFFSATTRYVVATNPSWEAPPFLGQVNQFGAARVFAPRE